MSNFIRTSLFILISLVSTGVSSVALALDGPSTGSTSNTCTGCKAEVLLGTSVSAPGITLSVVLTSGHNSNGKCKIVSGICQKKKKCNISIDITHEVAAGTTEPYIVCYWVEDEEKWECVTVTGAHTSDMNGISTELPGSLFCGSSGLLNQLKLGNASLTYQTNCTSCN